MREFRKSGSVGAPGGQPSGATRPRFSPKEAVEGPEMSQSEPRWGF